MYIDTNIHIDEDDTLEVSSGSDRRGPYCLIDFGDAVIYIAADKARELLKKLKDTLK